MQRPSPRAEVSRRLHGDNRVAALGQPGGIGAGAGADVENARRRSRQQVQDDLVLVGEGDRLVARDELVGLLGVALGAADRTAPLR